MMSKRRHCGKQQRSYGGTASSSNRQGKILYNSGDEPAFIRQFKERSGYQAPSTIDDKVESCFLFEYFFIALHLYTSVKWLLMK